MKNKRLESRFIALCLICGLILAALTGCMKPASAELTATPAATVTDATATPGSTDIAATGQPATTQPGTDSTAKPGPTDAPAATIASGQTAAPTTTKAPTAAPTKAPTPQPTTAVVTQPSGTEVSTAQATAPAVVTLPNNTPAPAVSLENVSAAIPADYKADYVNIKNQLLQVTDTVTITKTISGLTSQKLQTENERLQEIVNLLRYSAPELFYLGNRTGFNAQGSGNTATFTITFPDMFSTYGTKTQIRSMQTELNNKVTQIVNQAKVLSNSFERELYIHDYLVKNIKYTADEGKNYIRTTYGGLIKGEGVCEAYARSFQLLMLKLGEETYLITGDAGEAHMWNIIELGGKYYHVDVTWDDPTPDENLLADTSKYLIRHANLNQTDAFMQQSHTYGRSGDFTPIASLSCTSTDMNYYRIKGLLCTSIEVYKAVIIRDRDSFPSGYTKCIEVMFTIDVTAAQITQAIGEVRLSSGSYSYSYSVDTNNSSQIVRVYNW